MADSPAQRFPAAVKEDHALRPLPPATRLILRAAPAVIASAGRALGLSIDATPCRAVEHGAYAALWLGPDEYLLIGPESAATELTRAVEAALPGMPHSLVDVSHRQTALELVGAHAADILNSGCPLDLDVAVFPVGMCTRTVFAKCEIVLWRTAPDVFRIEVWRSFTDYLVRFLGQAAREFAGID